MMQDMMQFIVEMPYLADISVNHAYRRGSPRYGKKKVVTEWLQDFRLLVQNQLQLLDYRGIPERVRMDIRVFQPAKGRIFDCSNARKLPQDIAAATLGVDDSCFWGTDYPTIRVKDKYDAKFIFEFYLK